MSDMEVGRAASAPRKAREDMRRFAGWFGCVALAVGLLCGTPALAQRDVVIIPVDRLMWAVKRANLRSGAGTQYDKLGLLEIGEKVQVTGEAGNWLRLLLPNGRTAFVYAPLLGAEPPGSQAHRAIWEMHNIKPGETFDVEKGDHRATAFAIAPRRFLTNIHVLLGSMERDNSLATTKLGQEGSPVGLTVRRVLAVHVAHDLALFETGESVEDYLRLIDDKAPAPGERLLVVGYVDGKRRYEMTNGIVYEDFFSFMVPTAIRDLNGISGSPILDGSGRVAGLAYVAADNMLYGIKVRHVKAFVAGGSGTVCSRHADLHACLRAGAKQVEKLAADGDLQAIYELGTWDSNVNDIDSGMGLDIHSLAEAVRKGYVLAQFDLAVLYAERYDEANPDKRNDKNLETAFKLYKRAAEKGFPPSAMELGRYYFNGWGTERDKLLAAHWLRKSSDQGFLPAVEYMKENGLR